MAQPGKSVGASKSSSGGRKRRSTKRSEAPRQPGERAPAVLYAQASPRSVGGVSLFDYAPPMTQEVVPAFASEEATVASAVVRLRSAGFEVLQVSPVTINIAGPPSLYEQVFSTTLVTEERPVVKQGGREDTATFYDTTDTETAGLIDPSRSSLADVLEGVAIEEPVYFHAPDALAPLEGYHHLRVPGDVSLACNADKAHRGGTTGRNIKLVMVDSGWEPHPYFVQRGYRYSPTILGPAAANSGVDENGHGTGESANAFATAPDVDFTMVKINFVNSTGAFNAAVALNPHVISCSWGSSVPNGPLSAANQALAAAVAAAVAAGIVVVFSAGNGQFGFPGQHPDVVSAGGTFMNLDGSIRATRYTSGFASNVYPGRNVPDLSGLVGDPPGAAYIMLPIPAGCQIDVGRAGGTHPNGDETAADDGWAAFSGTSAAAPQIAGVVALMRQACPSLTPVAIRQILMATARDVTTGTNAMGNAAVAGYDLATGAGLVDANKAVLSAKVRCLGPVRPIRPVQPVVPITPVRPVQPVAPVQPISPVEPVRPVQPVRPIEPVILPGPEGPTAAEGAGLEAGGGPGLSAEDVAELERMIIESGEDPGLS